MSGILGQVLLIISAVLLLPAAVVLAEVALGVSERAPREDERGQSRAAPVDESAPRPGPGPRPRVAVLVPAHNEATNILGTLRSIAAQLSSTDRFVVIADNCTDQTAALAASEGCEVVVRTDDVRRGKGYALEAGVQHLRADAPDVVIIIDADSAIAPHLVDRLARRCLAIGRPVQARYQMLAPRDASLKTRIAALAWLVKNDVRPSGLNRLGLPCQLMGCGMAFPWACISTAELASGHIVEDLKLGIELALRDYPAHFCREASVTSTFATSARDLSSQRARWEHGHMAVICSDGPRLLWQSLRRRDLGLLALALDLCVPPLALLVLAMLGVCLADILLAATTGSPWSLSSLGLSLLALCMLAAAVLLAWYHDGRRVASLSTLALAPVYAIWKLPLYFRFVVARQTEWVRSKRAGDHPVSHR